MMPPSRRSRIGYFGNDQAEKADGLEKVTGPFKNGNFWYTPED